jgi:hypothetical protein
MMMTESVQFGSGLLMISPWANPAKSYEDEVHQRPILSYMSEDNYKRKHNAIMKSDSARIVVT